VSSYTIVVTGLYDAPFSRQLYQVLDNVQHIDEILDQLADEIILPILAEHYDESGIKQGGGRSGALKQAISKRGAAGNVIQKTPGHLIVGVDYAQIDYARWVIEGRGPVLPKEKKVLHWIDPDTGKDVFAKSAGPAPAHPIFFLTPSELDRVGVALSMKLRKSRFQ